MATVNQNEISFGNVEKGSGVTGKIGNSSNKFLSSTANVQPFVNAVEIDWNGASICEQTVTTTGQLLKIINDLYNKVNNISTDVKVSSISLDYTSSTWQADKGDTMNVTATVYPTGATNSTIKWTSSNTSVATVSSTSAKTITVTCKGYGSATIKCTQSGGEPTGELQTGSRYILETWTQEVGWQEVPCYAEVYWTAEAWLIPKDRVTEWEVKWERLYGQLSEGKYRIGKEITDFRDTGDYDTAIYYAEFEIAE